MNIYIYNYNFIFTNLRFQYLNILLNIIKPYQNRYLFMSIRNKEHKVFNKDQTATSIKTISGVIKDFDTFDGEKGSRNTIKKITI